ncbi:hypothetical protein J2S30_003595 [Herbaspirillum rubrisubalbicans]|nr:hypothetical protein [Herbaspirillum rubrisubalbicans]
MVDKRRLSESRSSMGTGISPHSGSRSTLASTIGSTDGNVSIVAGNRYTQVGSDVLVQKGDIDIAAKSLEVRAAEQASRGQ